MTDITPDTTWQIHHVTSPHLPEPVPVLRALDIPTIDGGNRFQNVTLYRPLTPDTQPLAGTAVEPFLNTLPGADRPNILVHIHGGAWRDPQLTATSIEATVAHAFTSTDRPIQAIASLNYSVSQFPKHPALAYDARTAEQCDTAREAVHPDHLRDVLLGLRHLRSLGLTDRSYLLSGHSAGACLAFQAALLGPEAFGLDGDLVPPTPAALFGINGLYDLPDLVDHPGASHAHVASEYENLLGYAFGDRSRWPSASPSRLSGDTVSARLAEGLAPRLVVLDQSEQDQLVPMNQLDTMHAALLQVPGLLAARGRWAHGSHAHPWEDGLMLWSAVHDITRSITQHPAER